MWTARIAGIGATLIVVVGCAGLAEAQATTPTPSETLSTATARRVTDEPNTHRALLSSLYGSYIGLQALDIDSTLRGTLSGRTQEANPVVGAMAQSPALLVAFKAGTAAAIIGACEQLRKEHHATAAVLLMIGLNSAYATVVAHNYALLRQP